MKLNANRRLPDGSELVRYCIASVTTAVSGSTTQRCSSLTVTHAAVRVDREVVHVGCGHPVAEREHTPIVVTVLLSALNS